jgi:hypothetical protein
MDPILKAAIGSTADSLFREYSGLPVASDGYQPTGVPCQDVRPPLSHGSDISRANGDGVNASRFHKKLLLDTPQLAGGRKGASPRSGLNLVFFDA